MSANALARTRALVALLLLPALLALGGARAGATNPNTGTSGAQFLKLGSGARAGGMADAFTGIADDVHAVYYNPAGLAQLSGSELGGAHTSLFQGISYDALDFAYPVTRADGFSRQTLALGLYHLGVGDIERRVGDTTDAVGTFGAASDAYTLSYAYGVDRRLSVGATGKYISETIDTFKSTAYAFDAGLLYRVDPDAPKPMSVAVALKNVGSREGYVAGQTDPLPTAVVFGLGYQPSPTLKLDLDLGKARDTDPYAALGGEYVHPFSPDVSGAFRFGYTSARMSEGGLNGLSFGAGLNFHRAGFDFAWQPFGDLGDTFRYSLLVKF